jgi:2-oxoglutarate dehydrogenase E2 component (dihydrolipoamide succinyltransferase)
MKKMLLICVALMMVAAMVYAQAPAAPAPAKDAPKAAMAPAAGDVKTVSGMLSVDVAKKEASIKVGDKVTKLEFNKVAEDSKLAGKTVEAKGTMKADVLTATEIKEATAAPVAPKADMPKADAPKADAPAK